MMNELTYDAKIAVLKILCDIVYADHIVHENEVHYMDEIARSFNLSDNYMDEVNKLVTLQALSIVRTFAPELKEKFSQLMGKMIVIDEDINYNEVKLYNAVCDSNYKWLNTFWCNSDLVAYSKSEFNNFPMKLRKNDTRFLDASKIANHIKDGKAYKGLYFKRARIEEDEYKDNIEINIGEPEASLSLIWQLWFMVVG